MFRKLAYLLIGIVLLGAIVIVTNTQSNTRSITKESMIVLNANEITNEKNMSQDIAIATNAIAKEIQIESQKKSSESLDRQLVASKVAIQKPIFDTTLYKNKKISNESFFIPMTILYKNKLLPKSDDDIDISYLTELAKSLPKSDIPVILDIEHWSVHTMNDGEANQNIDKYILVIDTMKKARPDLKFGYYGVLPNRDYWAPVSNKAEKITHWNHINKRLKRLAEHVDIVCPSLYTFYDDPAAWEKFAIENIKRAREYGKPVYVFLWPQYHDSNRILRGEFVASNIWLEQLKLINHHADGIIVWGGFDLKKESYGKMDWDESATWWQVTKKFITDENR